MVDPRVSIDAKKAILRQNIIASFGCISVDSLSIAVENNIAKCDFSGTCSEGQFEDSLVIYKEDDFIRGEDPAFETPDVRIIALGEIYDDFSTSFAMFGVVPVLVTVERLFTGNECVIVTLGNIVVYDKSGVVVVTGSGSVVMPERTFYDDLRIYIYQPLPVPSTQITLSFNIDANDPDAYDYFSRVADAGGYIPPDGIENINNLFVALKNEGLFDKLLSLQLFANYGYIATEHNLIEPSATSFPEPYYSDREGVVIVSGDAQGLVASFGSDDFFEDIFFGVGVKDVSGDGHIAYFENETNDTVQVAIVKNGSTFDAGIMCDPDDIFDADEPLGRDIVLVRDGTTSSKVYVNGALVQSDSAAAGTDNSANAINLGSDGSGLNDINATYLWSATGAALDAGEVAELSAIITNYLAEL
jgi:hypothetical protein